VTITSLESIAVIGISARYPQARNLDQYWDNLRAGKECISVFTEEELLAQGLDPADVSSAKYVKARGFYEGTYDFDASFFGYSPREAELIDPQQRVFLECCWEALENSGHAPTSFPGTIGVFAGAGPTRHFIRIADVSFVQRSFGQFAIVTSNDRDYLASRVGYKLNLRGPCVGVQTACSTSLVAICMACQNLLSYQCDVALAGGVSLLLNDKEGYWYEEGGILSPDGHCRTFDASAQGTLFCQGAGAVVLRRLDDALIDHDNIYAVIRGFGLNNDGAVRAGFTAPGVDGQVEVSSQAIEMAGISPETIGFVECHGTATPIGDPIEITALTKSFRKYTQKKNFCAVGSVKTNIGHTDAAAGVAGFTKAVLALKNKAIPASLHFQKPNPQIDFDDSPFFVNTQLLEWKPGEEPRRAGVNSFGVGGTNAHVIVEEAPPHESSSQSRPIQILAFSAKTSAALEIMTTRLANHLEQHAEENLADVAFTLQVGRVLFPHRRIAICRNREQAITALSTIAPGQVLTRIQREQGRPVAFLFPGQGSQYVGMGKQLYMTEPYFRRQLDECANTLRKHMGRDIRELLFPEERQRGHETEELDQTSLTQPCLFAVEYSLAKLWMDWGVRPEAMLGHSLGEYVAACLSDVLTLEDALALVATRGRLMQQLPRGSMMAVMLPEAEASPFLPGDGSISIAAVNSRTSCTVSGVVGAIDELRQRLEAKGITVQVLRTSHAFHSAMMEPICETFRAAVQAVRRKAPTIPYVSNLTGTWITAAQSQSIDYWVDHLRHAVRFADGVGELLSNPMNVFLEVGPGRTLSSLVAQHPAYTLDRTSFASLPHPKNDQHDMEFALATLGQLWMEGSQIHWDDFYRNEQRRRVALPTYPFEHEQYRLKWPANTVSNADLAKKKTDLADWFYYPSWKRLPLIDSGSLDPTVSWVLFLDDLGIGAKLAESLRANGHEVFTVVCGRQFEQKDSCSFTLSPGEPKHYSLLLKNLRASNKTPGYIVHLWSTVSAAGRPELETVDKSLDLTFYSLVFLAQAIGSYYATSPINIYVVSNDLYDVAGDRVFAPSRATLLGPCKTIPHEYRNVTCRHIDLHVPQLAEDYSRLIEDLISECKSGVDDVVAYRGRYRWIQLFDHLRVPSAAENSPRLRKGGTYLITGGLGGIGLVIAEFLAQTVHAKLILVGRTPFPEREMWPQWLADHASEDRVSLKIKKLQAIESAGGEVVVFSGDTSDRDRMRQIVEKGLSHFGPIQGVIHAAGVAGDGIIDLKTKEITKEVLEPKVKGTLVLEEVLRDADLDFFLLCSSVNSILPGAGLVDYTAANAFMDAFAYSRHGQGGIAPISVDWDRWDEVGMAVEKAGIGHSDSGNREAIDHPLFSARTKDGDESYILSLNPAGSWIVGEHKIEGQYTLVGTGYIELARSAFAIRSSGPIEVEDVFFMFPLMIKEGESREVQVVLKPAGNGSEFLIRSSQDGKTWKNHAMGKIRTATGEPRAREHNLKMMERCSRQLPLEFLTGKVGAEIPEQKFLQFGARWNCVASIRFGNDNGVRTRSGSMEGIAKLELAPQFAGDLTAFPLHPALMDRATSWAVRSVVQGVKYLPFAYSKLKIYKPLVSSFYSYAKLKSTDYDDFISFDLCLIDEQGDSLVEIEGFDLKRVEGQVFGSGDSAKANGQAVEAPKRDRWGDCILSKEGIDVFQRILAMAPMPHVIIATKEFSHLLSDRQLAIRKKGVEGANPESQTTEYPRPNLATPYVAPRNQLEEGIAQVWASVLGVEKVGVNDDFLDLGGHSLLAIQLAARIRDMFEIELSVAKLYASRTVAGLAKIILETLASEADQDVIEQVLQEMEALTDGIPEPANQHEPGQKVAGVAG
jgi:acyl transferase domain-containing protein/acyl carrier protein